MRPIAIALGLTLLGCAPAEERATSGTLQAIDTLKAAAVVATDSGMPVDTVRPRADSTKRPTPTPPRVIKGRDSIIGRDSAIPLDPKKPRLDTVKRPPAD